MRRPLACGRTFIAKDYGIARELAQPLIILPKAKARVNDCRLYVALRRRKTMSKCDERPTVGASHFSHQRPALPDRQIYRFEAHSVQTDISE